MYKLLLLDIDGTLQDAKKGIPYSAIQAIDECRKNNCKVMICTGRSLKTISDQVLSLHVDGIIAGGGSYISVGDEIVQAAYFPRKQIQEVLLYLLSHEVAFAFETQEKVFMNDLGEQILLNLNHEKELDTRISNQLTQEKIVYESNIEEYRGQPIHKICLWTYKEVYQDIYNILKDTLHLSQSDQYGNQQYYEIVQKGFDKGSAIQIIQEKLKIKKEETICFGDGLNDQDMFKASHTCIAMPQGHPTLKQMATSVCEDIFEDGIYLELQRRNICKGEK